MKESFILELIEKFNEGDITSLDISEGNFTLSLKKETFAAAIAPTLIVPQTASVSGEAAAAQASITQSTAVPLAATALQAQQEKSAESDEGLVTIKSPLVGTFYRAPSPDAHPYVEVGTRIEKGKPLCILEAMKMMNTLECEADCIIRDILVENGVLVEFDQPLFVVELV